jgi:CNT family concentrative nucleoside transporter
MERFIGILGILAILGIAYLLSNNKRKINLKLILWGLSLQLFFAILILKVPGGKIVFDFIDSIIKKILDFSVEGSKFLFGNLGNQNMFGPWEPNFPNDGTWPGFGFQFAFLVLPTVIFFSSLMSVLYHIGIMQKIIKFVTKIMQKTMGTSGAETASISANIFVGQTEAPLVIKPFISKMTKSELTAIMTGGFATVAGGVMAAYVLMLSNVIPGIAGHLMAASIMSAPAALVIAKIIYPETSTPETSKSDIELSEVSDEGNFLEALGNGASEGMKLALNIAAMLIAFLSVIALLNWVLSLISFGETILTIELILGYLFMPLAFLMGAPWSEAQILGSLMGQKLVLTEFIAYGNLAALSDTISVRTATIGAYALCGFANFASIGIQLGGIGAIAPERKKDLAKTVTKAMLGGALASWLTATIAGILI